MCELCCRRVRWEWFLVWYVHEWNVCATWECLWVSISTEKKKGECVALVKECLWLIAWELKRKFIIVSVDDVLREKKIKWCRVTQCYSREKGNLFCKERNIIYFYFFVIVRVSNEWAWWKVSAFEWEGKG